ncbi:MAG: CBS domain-containing protein [Candidatus Poseidoniaceae archaeon]|nr:CBS domain-containing protein [Candidatus Poseidoniaceae archaeon]
MERPHALSNKASLATILEKITINDWDHIFIVDEYRIPMGRIHAVDILKMIANKTVNRNVAWMHAIPAQQLVNLPPLKVGVDTPLLKAAALLLTHDLNQIAVVDGEGCLVGVVSHATISRHIPKFIL